MNIKSIAKKTLPLIVILLLVIGIAVTCTALKKTKADPVISNPEGNYITASEDGFEYIVKNESMYKELKNSVGLSTLINYTNTQILKAEGFYDKVSDEDIAKEIEEAKFPDGKDDLTEEEIAEAEEKYEKTMFSSYGLNSEEEYKEYYRLVLAKKAYAASALEKEIKKKDDAATKENEKFFGESDYTKYYSNNYKKEFWAIIVPFSTEKQAKDALAQLGVSIHKKDAAISDDFDHWVKKVGEQEVDLTTAEVVKTMINLYNNVYAYKLENYPTERLVLNEGKQYTVDEFGNYQFNKKVSEDDKDLNLLHYTYDELSSYQTSILNSMVNTWVSYTTNSANDKSQKWYTVNPVSYNSGSLYCFVLKIEEKAAPDLADVKDEIFGKLKEERLTQAYIETKMGELRASKNFTIYDNTLESNYISSMKTYGITHKVTKTSKKNVIASFDGKEVTTDELFKLMDKPYGVSYAISLLNHERYMVNTKFNKAYDYLSTSKDDKKKWSDLDKYKEMKQKVSNEKLVFTSGTYASYGYSPDKMTWIEFIKAIYGVDTEQELLVQFYYDDITSDFKKSLSDLTDLNESSDLWKFYLTSMEKIKNEYFSVKGVHLLISVYNDPKDITDSKASPLDPKDWSEEQVTLAKELHNQILAYIEAEDGTIQEKMQAIADAFKKSLKFVANLEQNVEAQPVVEDAFYTFKNIEVAKFRSAGLSVKYEDLGSFKNGKMVTEFNDAVKSIWDKNPDTEEMEIYREYLQTVFGFHVYANLACYPLEEWEAEDGTKGVLPTFEMIQKYLKDSSDETLTDKMTAAITTYFKPVQTELGGNYNTYIEQYNAIKALNTNLTGANYSKDVWEKAIALAIENWNKNLTYNKRELAE